MNITCIQCSNVFSISAEQLGKRGKCPHCRATIVLPRSTNQTRYQAEQLESPSRLNDCLLCGFVTVVLHLLVLFLCAQVPWGDFADGQSGTGERILIGQLPREKLIDSHLDEFTPVEMTNPANSRLADVMDSQALTSAAENALAESRFDLTIPSLAGGAQQTFEAEPQRHTTLLAGGKEDFGDLISRLKKDGLDVVIVFDSTKSMKGEIEQVKSRIERIGNVLFQLVPKTRISICTYRDRGDEYVVKDQPLTDNLTTITLYLEGIQAEGGGNIPEAVFAGLQWAIHKNDFRSRARKVILLFGDAQPHPNEAVLCQKLASDFRKLGGIVSTVTCRKNSTLTDFDAIAKIGGGESYLTRNEREIMSQLIVLVFGSRHRAKVLEAFDLLDRSP